MPAAVAGRDENGYRADMGLFGRRSEFAEDDDLPDVHWHVPGHAYAPGAVLAAAMALLWAAHVGTGGMAGWGVSGAALASGRFETIALHMFAHANLVHVLMNAIALAQISGPLVARLGGWPGCWVRYLALFALSGLSGMALFLAVHPGGDVPLVGASGAIYGLLGVLLRLSAAGEEPVPIRSRAMGRAAIQFLKDNLFLFLVLSVPALLTGSAGGVAWEAHVGGFLAGLLIAPRRILRGPMRSR